MCVKYWAQTFIVCCSFNNAFSATETNSVEWNGDKWMMNWKRCWRRSWPNLRYYPGICLEGLRKTTNNLSRDSRSQDRDLNPDLRIQSRSVNYSTTTFSSPCWEDKVARLAKKISDCHGTRSSIVVFTRVRHWNLSCASWMQSSPFLLEFLPIEVVSRKVPAPLCSAGWNDRSGMREERKEQIKGTRFRSFKSLV
jgi:hypothetical protein